MAKPTSKLDWTDATPANRLEPLQAKKDTGWVKGEKPAGNHLNWNLYNLDQWVKWLEENAGIPASPSISMVWKDAATITLQAGIYRIGGSLHELAANTDWSWTLDTGVEAVSTWYYLYLADVSGTPTPVASVTPPTSRFDTDLSGTDYDTNIYLGAFYNNSGGNIEEFYQTKNRFSYITGKAEVNHNTTTWTIKTVQVPVTASFAVLEALAPSNTADTRYGRIGIDGANTYAIIFSGMINAAYAIRHHIIIPIKTAQSIYMKIADTDAADSIRAYTLGWIDRYL